MIRNIVTRNRRRMLDADVQEMLNPNFSLGYTPLNTVGTFLSHNGIISPSNINKVGLILPKHGWLINQPYPTLAQQYTFEMSLTPDFAIKYTAVIDMPLVIDPSVYAIGYNNVTSDLIVSHDFAAVTLYNLTQGGMGSATPPSTNNVIFELPLIGGNYYTRYKFGQSNYSNVVLVNFMGIIVF